MKLPDMSFMSPFWGYAPHGTLDVYTWDYHTTVRTFFIYSQSDEHSIYLFIITVLYNLCMKSESLASVYHAQPRALNYTKILLVKCVFINM